MTHGTSAHGGGLSTDWTASGQDHTGIGGRLRRHRIIGEVALLQLLCLSLIAGAALGLLSRAGQSIPEFGLYLAVLLAVSAAIVLLALRPCELAPREPPRCPEPSRLLAQMHHELRTPLNAVLGFSEAMQHELHGPLGNPRYQEYAAHISASGGRLLKASEDAIAVATSMSALLAEMVADGRMLRRERLPLAGLLKEAWMALDSSTCGARLDVSGCGTAEIKCDAQAMSRALQHLLSEAIASAPPGGTIVARSSRDGAIHWIEIAGHPPQEELRVPELCASSARCADGLCLLLARALLELQGASLSVGSGGDGRAWSARIVLAAAATSPARRRHQPANAAVLRPAAPVHQAGFALAAVSHAMAGSHAAPPARERGQWPCAA
ncbi:MAG TPA: histidine kinase dimerization/phospho-acceptor domain-containing protein [Hyphomicrobiaceae bacterium]|nr:histidine kinase dimerization/phospho-acceptor domain-containing protein [Hyphomicrobiaceae bacterium]